MIHSQPAEASAVDLSLHMGLSSIAAAQSWAAAKKDDPWAQAHAHKLGFASVTAEHGSSVHLDGDSFNQHMIGAEDETVYGRDMSTPVSSVTDCQLCAFRSRTCPCVPVLLHFVCQACTS